MDSRLAEQLVEWHNRHPLARRISIFDVHTIGVVALPFMRSGRPEVQQIEPGFAPPPEAPALDAAAEAGSEAPAEAEAAPAAPPAAVPSPATPFVKPGLMQRLRSLLGAGAKPQAGWPLFSERFISRLSPRRVARFALAHGNSNPPGAPDWPLRTIEIDEDLMLRTAGKAAGAWPVELYLITAGIDAGPARTRVLMGHGSGDTLHVLGRRCLDPRRLLLALGLPALLLAGAAALWWVKSHPAAEPEPELAPAGTAASAAASAAMPAALTASAPVQPASGAASEAEAAASAVASAAAASEVPSTAASAASAAETAASAPTMGTASGVPFVVAPGGIPDIRPRIAPAGRARASEPASASPATAPAEAATQAKPGDRKAAAEDRSADKKPEPSPPKGHAAAAHEAPPTAKQATGSEAKPAKAQGKAESQAHGKSESKAKTAEAGDAPQRAATPAKALAEQAGSRKPSATAGSSAASEKASAGSQVALVGPASPSKAQAEATLERMRSLLGQTVRDPGQLQAQVFQTKEGWRPAVWPFSSREQAQLVNATLIASGLRTKAVDF